jgi:hypothetical protein
MRIKMWEREYQHVNDAWPAGSDDGRLLKPTPAQAMHAAQELYRLWMGRPWWGTWKLVSGRQYMFPIYTGVFRVNPDRQHGREKVRAGWHGVIHLMAHYVARRRHGEVHGPRQAAIEREMIEYAVAYLLERNVRGIHG